MKLKYDGRALIDDDPNSSTFGKRLARMDHAFMDGLGGDAAHFARLLCGAVDANQLVNDLWDRINRDDLPRGIKDRVKAYFYSINQ